MPATGEGISVSTLSVETSRSGSSTATSSPSCFSQRVTVPSVTDSPSAGIFTVVPPPESPPGRRGAAGGRLLLRRGVLRVGLGLGRLLAALVAGLGDRLAVGRVGRRRRASPGRSGLLGLGGLLRGAGGVATRGGRRRR